MGPLFAAEPISYAAEATIAAIGAAILAVLRMIWKELRTDKDSIVAQWQAVVTTLKQDKERLEIERRELEQEVNNLGIINARLKTTNTYLQDEVRRLSDQTERQKEGEL